MKDYHSKFATNQFYHVYNRANGTENLFIEQKNYNFFLKRWDDYLADYLNVWTYCLIPNHFHFLVRINDDEKLVKFLKSGQTISDLISNQFRNLFISYTKSFNKVYNRNGSLFQKPFRHVLVNSEPYLFALIHYIHHNPIHHKIASKFTDWTYSSYPALIGDSTTKVARSSVLELFGGKSKFISFHNQMKDYKQIEHLIIE